MNNVTLKSKVQEDNNCTTVNVSVQGFSIIQLPLTGLFHLMAARAHAAPPLCLNSTVFSCFYVRPRHVFYSSSSRLLTSRRTYSRKILLHMRGIFTDINPAYVEELHDCGLLWRPAQPPAPTPVLSP